MYRKVKLFLIPLALLAAFPGLSAIEREVKVENTAHPATLAGTLSLPDHGQPRAALVLATGSGPQNRDEEVFGLKPFKTIADSLTAHGYAVLRMDDRGVGESTGCDFREVNTEILASDVAAGLAALDSLVPSVPHGVLGHSEGGAIAMILAPRADFIITLAGPAWPGDSIVMYQSRTVALANSPDGTWPMEGLQRSILNIAKSTTPAAVAKIQINTLFAQALGDTYRYPGVADNLNAQVDGMLTTWYREFLRFDPAEYIRKVNVPWLALNGDKDTQVDVACLERIKELCPRADVQVMPSHNHMFQIALTGFPAEYATIPYSPSPATISSIIDWLDNNLCPENQ